ncbi:hypothetical protein ACFLQ0_03765 [Nitrospinota bacterium]
MNVKRYVLAALGVFVFLFVFEYLWHGVGMQGLYKQTASVWRPEKEMNQLFHWVIITQLAFAFVFAFIFTRNYEGKGLGEGFRYGVYMGLFMAVMQVGIYPYLPIPFSIAAAWFVGSLVAGIGGGVLLSLIYRDS